VVDTRGNGRGNERNVAETTGDNGTHLFLANPVAPGFGSISTNRAVSLPFHLGHELLFLHSASVEGNKALARETITKLIDDIDGSVASETVTFGLDGYSYQIDLSAKNAKKLRTELAPYLESGHRVTGRAVAVGRAGRRGRATVGDKDQNKA